MPYILFNIKFCILILATLVATAACKQPFAGDLSEYKGNERSFVGAIENGRVTIKVAGNSAKMHSVKLLIEKEAALGNNGVTIPLSEIKLPEGKLETVIPGANSSVEICFLRADSTLAGGKITCSNFREACEGTGPGVTEDEKRLYGGVFTTQGSGSGLCQCVTGGDSKTQVGFTDFLAKSGPELICQDIRLKETSVTPVALAKFREVCESEPIKGKFASNNIKDASCQCAARAEPFTITAAMGELRQGTEPSLEVIEKNLRDSCENKTDATAALCKDLTGLAEISYSNQSTTTGASAVFVLRDDPAKTGDEACVCRKNGQEVPTITVSLGDLRNAAGSISEMRRAVSECISYVAEDSSKPTVSPGAEDDSNPNRGANPVAKEGNQTGTTEVEE